MDSRIKSRLRLWLLSERAMGLPAVGGIGRLSKSEGMSRSDRAEDGPALLAGEDEIQIEPPERPRAGRVQSPAQAPLTANLFGADDVAPPASEGLMPPPTSFPNPALSREEKTAALAAMEANEVRGCTKCRLCEQRTQTVFGEGDPDAKIFFIGEGPGETEDRTGRPFVGRAGELLTKMILGMGLKREQVYIANIVKCRPPQNRVPAPDEVATCTPYLEGQLEIVRPQVIVTLGLPSSRYMLQSNLSMGRLRGNWHAWRGIKLMPTFHPAYILRNDTRETKALVWSDLKQVMAEVGLPIAKAKTEASS